METEIKGKLVMLDEQWEANRAFSQRVQELVRERHGLLAEGREQDALTKAQILEKVRAELGPMYPEFFYGTGSSKDG